MRRREYQAARRLLAKTPIFTVDSGKPIPGRPDPEDFGTYWDFVDALQAYKTRAVDVGNAEFYRRFSRASRF